MENPRKKRKLIINKLVDNCYSQNNFNKDKVIIFGNELIFTVPSNSKKDKHHVVKFDISNQGDLSITCSCNSQKNLYCKHVNSSIITFLSKFIKCTQDQHDSIVNKNEVNRKINNLTDILNDSLKI